MKNKLNQKRKVKKINSRKKSLVWNKELQILKVNFQSLISEIKYIVIY